MLESQNTILINMVAILMYSAKLTTLDLLEIKVLQNNVIIPVNDVTNKILLSDVSYIAYVLDD